MTTQKQWIGISDLMAVLMMVFLFIAILFMLQLDKDQKQTQQRYQKMTTLASEHHQRRQVFAQQLRELFADDLKRWQADVLANGTVRFNNPELLFTLGDSQLKDRFKKTLDNFFPRYIALIVSSTWQDEIDAILIEGHTSSDWGGQSDYLDSYLDNAWLSQARAFSVLRYVYSQPEVAQYRPWLRQVLRASGLSFSRPIIVDGLEHKSRSRRVEFYIQLRDQQKINDILYHSQKQTQAALGH